MKENIKNKKYLLELSKQLEQQLKEEVEAKRVVCGFKDDAYGRTIVTTGIPKEYKPGQITYEDKKTVSYEDYITSQVPQRATRRR